MSEVSIPLCTWSGVGHLGGGGWLFPWSGPHMLAGPCGLVHLHHAHPFTMSQPGWGTVPAFWEQSETLMTLRWEVPGVV